MTLGWTMSLWWAACGQETNLSARVPPVDFDGSPTADDPGGETIDGRDPRDPDGIDASTAGTRFLLAYMENLNPVFNGPPSFELWIESAVATRGEVRLPATGFVLGFDVEVGVNPVALPTTAMLEPIGSGVTAPLGLEITTDDAVQVVALHHRSYFTEATRLLPEEELGVTYRVIAVQSDDGAVPSEFVVVAGADGTEVTITPSVLTNELRPAGKPFTVALDRGEVFQLQSNEDLSGTTVVATQRIALFGGAREPIIDCAASSHAWEQLPPTSRFATDWLVAPWKPDQPYGYALVLADEDDTEVTLDCEVVATLDEGEMARVRLDAAGRIRSNRPVLVAQTSIGGGCSTDTLGDPNLLLATPTVLSRSSFTARPIDDPTFGLVANRRDRVVMFLDGGELSVSPDPVETVEDSVDDLTTSRLAIEEATRAENPALRGFAYGVSLFNAYSYNLGWDCVGCATELRVPATCD